MRRGRREECGSVEGMRRWLLVLALAGCGAPTVTTDAQTMDASASSEGSVLLDAASEESAVVLDAAQGVDAQADARADHELFDGPYGGEPSAVGRCYDEAWRPRQGYEVGSAVPPMSFRRCDVAGTFYPFYGREFCDARVRLIELADLLPTVHRTLNSTITMLYAAERRHEPHAPPIPRFAPKP